MAGAVFIEGTNFLQRLIHAACAHAIFQFGVLVDVVTQMQYHIEVSTLGQLLVNVEKALGEIRAGGIGNAQMINSASGQGTGTANVGPVAINFERVIIGLPRRQAVDIHLGGEIPLRRGLPLTGAHHLR